MSGLAFSSGIQATAEMLDGKIGALDNSPHTCNERRFRISQITVGRIEYIAI